MADELTVDLQGITELIGGIEALRTATSGEGLNKLATQTGAILLNRIRTRFLAETDPDGKRWVPSRGALKRRAGGYTTRNGKRYTSTGTLFESGALFQSLQLGRATRGAVKLGTDVKYAPQHQLGQNRNPVRVFLGFSADDQDVANDFVSRKLEKIFQEGDKGKTP